MFWILGGIHVPISGRVERYDGPGVERERPYMLRKVAVAANRWVASIGFGIVLWEEVLIGAERATECTLIVPRLLECVNNVGFVVSAVAELEQIFFGKAAWDVEYGPHSRLYVALLRTYKAHQV